MTSIFYVYGNQGLKEQYVWRKGHDSFTLTLLWKGGGLSTSEPPDLTSYRPDAGISIRDLKDGDFVESHRDRPPEFAFPPYFPNHIRTDIENAWDENRLNGLEDLGWDIADYNVWAMGNLEITKES